MKNDNPGDVTAAFEILLEEIETDIESINSSGARAFEKGDYDGARDALERGGHLTGFREKVATLRQEWQRLVRPPVRQTEEKDPGEQRRLAKLRRGLRTPEEAYFVPILTALVESGGRGRMADILERVRIKMHGVLRDVDFEPLLSDPEMPRWRNAGQWARNTLVKDGLLSAESPRGVWEITGPGREYLRAHSW
jgi:restriction system protein